MVWGEQRSTVTAFQGFRAALGERRTGWGCGGIEPAIIAIKHGRGTIETGQASSVRTSYSRPHFAPPEWEPVEALCLSFIVQYLSNLLSAQLCVKKRERIAE